MYKYWRRVWCRRRVRFSYLKMRKLIVHIENSCHKTLKIGDYYLNMRKFIEKKSHTTRYLVTISHKKSHTLQYLRVSKSNMTRKPNMTYHFINNSRVKVKRVQVNTKLIEKKISNSTVLRSGKIWQNSQTRYD